MSQTPRSRPGLLRLAPAATLAVFLMPIAAGLAFTLLPAFGWLPAIGGTALSLDPWRTLAAQPGIGTALRLTLTVGLGTALAALLLAAGFAALAFERPWFARLGRAVAPLLATPHAAIAIGFAFLILPSGWIARAISPELTGWLQPPALATVRDPWGLAFAAGLLLKEVPYLVLMMAAATAQLPARALVATARTLGYGPVRAWAFVVLPRLYPQLRLPVYAVLAFSLSVVDVALILAPGTPPPLAVLAARWFADYDIARYFPAAAAAVLQLVLMLAAIGLWRLGELAVAAVGRRHLARGRRRGLTGPVLAAAGGLAAAAGAAGLLAILGMLLWSVARSWRFPDAWPQALTAEVWAAQAASFAGPAGATLAIGLAATGLALVLALACLEHEQRRGRAAGAGALWLLYLPLLVPQIAFLFGAQLILVRLGLDGTFGAVVAAHLLFVLPYVFLSLADPYRALDPRYARAAAALGATPARVFFRVKLPLLARPVLIAVAVGFAVSVGQYLPTLFAGAGRVATLTTEAVTLASGADRRVMGVYATLQAALPLALYVMALALPRLLFANRRGMA